MSLELTIERDKVVVRAALLGWRSQLSKLGIEGTRARDLHYQVLLYCSRLPHELVIMGIDPQKDLNLRQREYLCGCITMEEYQIIVECEVMGDLK